MGLSVGRITYLNCIPYFHFLDKTGFAGRIVDGVPVELNRLLAAGQIDVSPSSSFEYALNASDYLLLPDLSISCIGPVDSVLLFTSKALAESRKEDFFLTGESATSVNLLKVLLREFCGFKEVRCQVPDRSVEQLMGQGGNALLIGDRALRAARNFQSSHQIIDLGDLWHHFTGLPFVFALWIVRKETVKRSKGEVATLHQQLCQARDMAFESLESLAEATSKACPLPSPDLVKYWQKISYELNDSHIQGLKLFFLLAVQHGLLEKEPELEFFELS